MKYASGDKDLVQCITVHLLTLNLSCQVSTHSDSLYRSWKSVDVFCTNKILLIIL